MEKEIDEITVYQSARWISPAEAMWRIFSFNLPEIYPIVYSLQLHVENHQQVTYNNEDDLSTIIENENTKQTMLTKFFQVNEVDEFARTLNPSERERYFLRVLMNHIRGSTSFHDLRTANRVIVLTYREAALLHGLISGDNHYEECLSESIVYQMPISLRRLFATLLVLCSPNNPKLLWDKFKCYMIDDYVHENIPSKVGEVQALEEISCILESLGKNINDYQMVPYNVNMNENDRLRRMIEDETTNLDIKGGLSGAFVIDGPGGTSKNILYKALLAAVMSQNSIALTTASSRIVASLLPRGRTAHSRFKIPLEIVGDVSCSVSKQSDFQQVLPVVSRGKKEDIMKASLVFSEL
ncbi:uncharacterized protein LOC111403853 [Olea europaea var. sylvestris]|uniref:uncharacterized protein LOC111403853 n=1 Tax=Olea europaea var. sylvestris TaxID=158386 RepID=UPI000C1D11D3|nr:uncharacterized protein LOC111403853 [Olea europaea var. sylvestris]